MKNLFIIIVSFFIFVGCAPKPEVSIPKKTVKQSNQEVIKETEVFEETTPQEIIVEPKTVEEDSKIAILYPSKVVGKYAKSTVNTVTAYLLYANKKFEVETFDTYNEESQTILDQVGLIKERGFTKVIALFTQRGFATLNTLEEEENFKVYFPLINKNEISTSNNNFIFGGISYEEQINLLKSLSSGKSSMFYVKSYIGNKLKSIYENSFENQRIIKEIQRKNNKFKYIMDDERIIGSSVLLNTPIIKTSIIMSQLTAYEIEPNVILSTQLNYNPLLMKLTQPKDRVNFVVASSIGEVNDFLVDNVKTLGADIEYNWVDYSSLVGVDYLLSPKKHKNHEKSNMALESEENSVLSEENLKNEVEVNTQESEEEVIITSKVENNQVVYTPVLYKTTAYGFKKLIPTEEN